MKELDSAYLDSLSIKDYLKNYASPKSKLTTMIKAKKVIQIRRGLYIPGGDVFYSIKTLANKIYGPSYISFEYALAYYGIIPERAATITSAVYNKNKHKIFHTPVGSFLYKPVPKSVYHQGIIRSEENGHPFLIASGEKAVCDTLYQFRTVNQSRHISDLIYEDLRMDPDTLAGLDTVVLETLCPLYGKRILILFQEWFKKEFGRA
jgi:hypothetical protein